MSERRTVFFVSDGTGITAQMLGHSLLTQFEGVEFNQVTLPFVEGIKREAELFRECLFSDQSKALIHVFFAERAVWKVPDVPDNTETLPVQKVGVIGAGTMGGGISMSFANAGIPVTNIAPAEGAIPIVFDFGVPKNAPNKDGAYAWLNASLEPQAQVGQARQRRSGASWL